MKIQEEAGLPVFGGSRCPGEYFREAWSLFRKRPEPTVLE